MAADDRRPATCDRLSVTSDRLSSRLLVSPLTLLPTAPPSPASSLEAVHLATGDKYCDAKIYAFNDVLFSVGFSAFQPRFLKMWFNVGVAFSVLTLVGVSAGENCMTPVQIRGMSWVEVSYLSPYSSGCLKYRRHSSEDTHQSCCFRISASLALVNSLPVYFLDGEAILETFFCYFTFINRRHRRKVLQCCLVGGSILSVISFSRIVYSAVVPE